MAQTVGADATGQATLPGVPPGACSPIISSVFNCQPLGWNQAVQRNVGADTILHDPRERCPPELILRSILLGAEPARP